MLKDFGPFLAMFALIASAVNSQCALSCSLQSRPSTGGGHIALLPTSHHACCPEKKSTSSNRSSPRTPCPNSLTGIDLSAVVTSVPHSDTVDVLSLLPVTCSMEFKLQVQPRLPSTSGSLLRAVTAAVFVLRI